MTRFREAKQLKIRRKRAGMVTTRRRKPPNLWQLFAGLLEAVLLLEWQETFKNPLLIPPALLNVLLLKFGLISIRKKITVH